MQKKWLAFISLVIMIILAATTVVFAWFTLVQKTQTILIYSGSIKLVANLYDEDNNEIIEAISFENVVPGDEFSFKLVISNEGNLDGKLDIEFVFSSNNPSLLNFFQIEYDNSLNTFNDGLTINNTLLSAETKEFPFKIIINRNLTLDDFNNGDFIKIENIILTLTQRDAVI